WYYDNYSQETVREFKQLNTMGISGEGTFGVLETIIQWKDSTGGGIKQTLTTDYAVHERSGTGTTWTEWKKTADVDWVGAQVSVLEDNINLRVKKGELLSQINIEAGRTLIQSNKLYLDAQSVVFSGQAFIPGAVIANASIDGAKIADATIGSAKIASLDVDKLSGNTGLWIRNEFNSINSTTSIDGSGLKINTTNTWDMRLGNSGIAFNGKDGALTGSLRATRSVTGDPEGTFLVAESDYLA